MDTVLGFDYGQKRIGVAVGSTLTTTAKALCIIRFIQNQPNWPHINQLIADWQPDALIVGWPLTMNKNRQLMTERSERFSRQLHGRYKLPAILTDECLSSFMAKDRLKTSKGIDAVAAEYILTTWLMEQDAKKHSVKCL